MKNKCLWYECKKTIEWNGIHTEKHQMKTNTITQIGEENWLKLAKEK